MKACQKRFIIRTIPPSGNGFVVSWARRWNRVTFGINLEDEEQTTMDIRILIRCAFVPLLAASAIAAETHEVVAQVYFDTFHHGHPVLKRIKPGDIVRTKTLDAQAGDQNGVRVNDNLVNALTGPFFVEGAEPGDALVVRLKRVRWR
jgi:hypothetical protein